MSNWISMSSTVSPIDFEILEESALAMAQSTIYKAIKEAGISKADLARKMNCNRSMVTRMLSGSHNLTVKTMSRALAACGSEVRFQRVPIQWSWTHTSQLPPHCVESAPCPQYAGVATCIGLQEASASSNAHTLYTT